MSDAPLTPCEARLGGPEGICLACPSEAVRDCILAASAPDAATDRVGTLSRLLRVLLSGEDGEAGAQAAKVCYHALQDAVADAHGSLHSALRGQDDPRSFLQTLDDAGARFGPRRPPAIVADMPSSSSSAAPGLYAVFAGQHVDYLEDLRHAYRTYHPVVGPLIEGVAAAITQQVATETVQHLASHELGLDIVAWITDTGAAVPPTEYLISAPVSFPCIFLAQIVNYRIAAYEAGRSLGEFRSLFQGATGHSQGIAGACVMAASGDDASLLLRSRDMAVFLLMLGTRCQQATTVAKEANSHLRMPPRARRKAKNKGTPEDEVESPTPMLAVVGISPDVVRGYAHGLNKALGITEKIGLAVSIINGPQACVVSGPEVLTNELRSKMGERRAGPGEAEPRVPHGKRKLAYHSVFLNATVPFHHPGFKHTPGAVVLDCKSLGLHLSASAFSLPVYSTTNGSVITGDNVYEQLALQIALEPVNWPEATSRATLSSPRPVSHILDFGPSAGVATITARNKDGTGTLVVSACPRLGSASGPRCLVGLDTFLSLKPSAGGAKRAVDWALLKPKVVKRAADGKLIVHTRYSQLTGRSPLLVAGMTPTTSYNGVRLVAACANAGYHVELAAGGLSRPAMFEERLRKVVSLLEPGVGLALNLLYLNAKQWAFQFDLCLKLRRQGLPVESITVAAGVPTRDVGADIITACQDAGLKYIGFKPGSISAIASVLEIAGVAPTFPVVMQWTGGRGGGHHSFEDMHQPILESYAAIRDSPNVVLLAGSGFGDASGSWPYLDGSWSEALGYPAMPFDGILLASRMMVAKEAATSLAVKALLVATPGITDESKWATSYEADAGGVITVRSELGEPIHKIATRGMLLWREFDLKYFSKPRGEERNTAIQRDKKLIIAKINADFQKLYFGQNLGGDVVDLEEMTYEEVAIRLAELMYITPQREAAADAVEASHGSPIQRHEDWRECGRWLHPTFKTRLFRFLHRAEERLCGSSAAAAEYMVTSPEQVDSDPRAFVDQVFARYTAGKHQLLCEEDVDFFYHLCRAGGKPVNFVPVIDGDLEVWFKKDSLWYSEDLAAVPEQDPQRVCILQGPVSVRYSTSMQESAADILNGINAGYLEKLGTDAVLDDASSPALGGLALALTPGADTSRVAVSEDSDARVYTVEGDAPQDSLPSVAQWTGLVATGCSPAVRAALTSPHVCRGASWVPNPVQRLVSPRPGARVRVTAGEVQLFAAAGDSKPAVEIRQLAAETGAIITVTVREARPATADMGPDDARLDLKFRYDPLNPTSPLHEMTEDLVDRVQALFRHMWFGDEKYRPSMDSEFVITEQDTAEFNRALGYPKGAKTPPMDIVVVVAWKPLVASLCDGRLNGNVMELVHLANEFESLTDGLQPALDTGMHVRTTGKVLAIENSPTGSTVKVQALCTTDGNKEPSMRIVSRFFFRHHAEEPRVCFSEYSTNAVLRMADGAAAAVLGSKEWLKLEAGATVVEGDELRVDVASREEPSLGNFVTCTVVGTVKRITNGAEETIGRVQFDGKALRNPVAEYLQRVSEKKDEPVFFENGGYSLLDQPLLNVSPSDNTPYATASRDLNPIHRNPFFAAVADLPGTIVHGMWSSGMARKAVVAATFGVDALVTRFSIEFDGMVLPGEELFTQVRHVGMRAGKLLLEVETVNSSGTRVAHGSAEAQSPATAFVFTGQGSAEQGMGMQLYGSSSVARAVWDAADDHLRHKFGFSILDIVRKNPTRLTIYFRGRQGARIRQNYLDLQSTDAQGNTTQLLKDITPDSESYTFLAPDGLLFSSQFTQCALVLQEKAALDDMSSQGLIPDDYMFAGHSLGEYAGLTAAGNLLSVDALVDIVFFRGLVMQRVVARDADGRSEFGMVAANPLRVGAFLTEGHLHRVVEEIGQQTGLLLQVVNYNVQGLQYVVAGHVVTLKMLNFTLTKLGALQHFPEDVAPLVSQIAAQVQALKEEAEAERKPFLLVRGSATIPLPGIDVPFHSRFLVGGVDSFRQSLRRKVDVARVKKILPRLVGRYIPNVTAKPFAITRQYVEETQKETGSAMLGKLLASWDEADAATIGYTLVIELLAYQFASPVRWIETQHYMFSNGVKRVVEIGPAPTLTNMALTTLQSKAYGLPKQFEVRFYGRDEDNERLYYRFDDVGQTLPEYVSSYVQEKQKAATAAAAAAAAALAADTPAGQAPTAPTPAAPPPAAPAPAPVAAAPAPAAAPAAGGSPPPEANVGPLEVLRVLLSLKLKMALGEVQASHTMNKLVGGKSAVLNELLGELEKEFGAAPDDAAEMTLSELAKTLGAGYSGLGKQTTGMINKLVTSKMPAGVARVALQNHLAEEYGLGPGRTDGLLLHSLTLAPSARLASPAEAFAWLATVAESYGRDAGVGVPKVSGGGAQAAAQAAAAHAPAAAPAAAAPVEDAPVRAIDSLRVLLAVKTSKQLADVPGSVTIKSLVSGNSALGNEVVGDLDKEFKGTPDGADELPLDTLAAQVGAGYTTLGAVTSAMTNKLVASKMPGGFGLAAVNGHLSSRGLGRGRSSGCLLHALTMAPPSRLADEAAATAWLDSVVAAYTAHHGISLAAAPAAAAVGGALAGGGPAVSSAALKQLSSRVESLILSQVDAGVRFLGNDPHALDRQLEDVQRQVQAAEAVLGVYTSEFGEDFHEGIRGSFDAGMVRNYTSYWNWVRQALLGLYHDLLHRRRDFHDDGTQEVRNYLLRGATPGLTVMANYLSECAARESNWRVSRYLHNLTLDLEQAIAAASPRFAPAFVSQRPATDISSSGAISYHEVPRTDGAGAPDFVKLMQAGPPGDRGPYLVLKERSPHSYNERVFSKAQTDKLFDCLADVAARGISFAGKVALVTGCGQDSIGVELVKMLLEGGAVVVATTSSFSRKKSSFYQKIYQQHGAAGSRLVVLPFNQASARDVEGLIKYIYGPAKGGAGLGLDLDIVFPFAAISENGRTIENIDGRSELAHRLMTTNVVRLMGAVSAVKRHRGITTRPATVVLPMSPNHGLFGSDGLYAESKLALESMLNKRESEGWSDYLDIVGAVIGWTRGTGLMSANNMTAEGVEKLGCWTFSTTEMAFCLISLLHPSVCAMASEESLFVDYSGGFDAVPDLKAVVGKLRSGILDEAATKKQLAQEGLRHAEAIGGPAEPVAARKVRARYTFEGTAFPPLPGADTVDKLSDLRGMIDLAQTVVVVGFGETGPWGGARTRWEMECHGEFSIEGCLELAWVTGLIKYHSGRLATTGDHYDGWVDAGSGQPVNEFEVKELYEPTLLKHCGIRLLEPEVFDGYDPHKKRFLQQVALDGDMPWIDVADMAEANEFRHEMGREAVAVRQRGDGQWQIRVLRGATVTVPRALRFDRFVAGQIPKGWDAKRLGIPDEIVNQVDRVTLYSLVATAEALVTAGISDPYELYEYVHVSGVGNTVGGGFGGMNSFREIFLGRRMDTLTQGDMLQETFINTVPAWINMLLLSSSGPVKTPVGACATAAESIELGAETILSGKAAVVICGGYDDIGEESMFEFAQMKATSSAAAEAKMGREPAEMCRPTTDTRAGFMESHGAGIQVLMSGAVAVAMGCPIYAVVALTSTATDKEGRSVPAPGQGILTTCRERPYSFPSPMLDMSYRRRNLQQALKRIDEWCEAELEITEAEAVEIGKAQGDGAADAFLLERQHLAYGEAARMRQSAQGEWGNHFFRSRQDIAPVRGALAVWGLSVDDISVASFHGTSTKANDKNESEVTQLQMKHLGRTPGNPVMVVCQKWLTGHPKGAAAAWMTNGLLQCMTTGQVPGNRNADNIDVVLADNEYLVYPNATQQVGKVKAALLKSFGFGQAGAEVVLVHPDYLLASLGEGAYEAYRSRRARREVGALRLLHRVVAGKDTLVRVKTDPPYTEAQQTAVYLDPTARAKYDPVAGSWRYDTTQGPRGPDVPGTVPGTPAGELAADADAADGQQGGAKRYDRREAEALLSALRRGRAFGQIEDPSAVLEDRHYKMGQRRPGEAAEEDEQEAAADMRRTLSPKLRKGASRVSGKTRLEVTMREAAEGVLPAGDCGIGIDVEPVKTFEHASQTFLDRNFTNAEQAYCNKSPHTAASFAGRWAAKEAVIKAISSKSPEARNLWLGAAAPLSDIEILRTTSGAPAVSLHGHAKSVATTLGITEVKVSISHVTDHAVAQAVTR